MMRVATIATFLAACFSVTVAFTAVSPPMTTRSSTQLFSSAIPAGEELKKKAAEYEEPQMNPDRPELPQLKGDFDWDEKYATDEDWLSGPSVPGRMVLNEIELAAQVTALTNLEETWRKERVVFEYDAAQKVGWSYKAETMNSRFAMFFLVVGLLTEYWTGITIPGQIEEMLRISGVIGFDG